MPSTFSLIVTLFFTRTNVNEEPENVPSNDRYRLVDSNSHVSNMSSLILIEWKASEEKKKVFVNTKATLFDSHFQRERRASDEVALLTNDDDEAAINLDVRNEASVKKKVLKCSVLFFLPFG